MALNINELVLLSETLSKSGKIKQAKTIEGMIDKLSAEWDTMDPEKQKSWVERQDWHTNPIEYINRPEKKPEPPTSGVSTKNEDETSIDEDKINEKALEDANKEFSKFLSYLDSSGISPQSFFDTVHGSGGIILRNNPETNKPEVVKDFPEDNEIDSSAAINKNDVLYKLAEMADRLDSIGATKEANLIDNFISKHASGPVVLKSADDQEKKYDAKYHHSLQVREPKNKDKKETKHSVKNYEGGHGCSTLSTRYCPEHPGVMLGRIGELTYQCSLDGHVYNYEAGWVDADGTNHPGGSVAGQTPDSTGYDTPHRVFDSRENTLNRGK